MNFPSDQITGSPTFHTLVERVEGGYRATNVSMPSVPPQVAESEQEAVRAIRMATEAYIGKGGK
jgi:hypothetical protein